MHRALACKAESGYKVWIRFDDGLEGLVHLENLLGIGAFKMLRDLHAFRAVHVDPQDGTITWPAGVRLDPEILYQDIAARGRPDHNTTCKEVRTMADSESTKARRAKIETGEWCWATVHTGTREMLIAAGYAKPEQFPGEPGCGKTSTVFPAVGAERKKRVRRRSTYLYEVAFYKTAAESAAYWAEREASMPSQDASAAPKAATELDPILHRLEGCSGLFANATRDIDAKIVRVKTAREKYANDAELEESAAELRDSSKLGRAVEDLQAVCASIPAIVSGLKRLMGEQ